MPTIAIDAPPQKMWPKLVTKFTLSFQTHLTLLLKTGDFLDSHLQINLLGINNPNLVQSDLKTHSYPVKNVLGRF